MLRCEESFVSGMGMHFLLHLSLTSERFVITVMLLRLPLVRIRPEQITSVELPPPPLFVGMTVNYVTDTGFYRVFTVRTAQRDRWREAFAQLGVPVRAG